MKKLLLKIILFTILGMLFYGASAQTIVYYEDFESNTGTNGFTREIVDAGGHNLERDIIKKVADIPDLADSNDLFNPTTRPDNRIPNGGARNQFAISTKAMDDDTNYAVDAYAVFTTLDLTSANALISASDTHKYATFWTQRRYGEGDIATVTIVVTTEYTGYPSTTSWTPLTLYSGKLGDTSDGRKYVQGIVDLTSYADGQGGTTVTLAFRYQGSSSAYSNSNRNGIFYFSDLQFIANSGGLSIEDDILNGSLSMYPNPVNNVLNINNPDGIIIKNISLINITGKTVYSGGNTATINVSSLSKGVYILKITSVQGVSSKKIIVK